MIVEHRLFSFNHLEVVVADEKAEGQEGVRQHDEPQNGFQIIKVILDLNDFFLVLFLFATFFS